MIALYKSALLRLAPHWKLMLFIAIALFAWQERGAKQILTQRLIAERADHERKFTQLWSEYVTAQALADAVQESRRIAIIKKQQEITRDVETDYVRRLAVARADAERLRSQARARIDRPSGRAEMSGLSDASGEPDGTGCEDRFSIPFAERLIATETAIRLDALQAWVRQQSAIDINADPDAGDGP